MTDTPHQIRMYLHCRTCITEKPGNVSAGEYARLEVGITHSGNIQVWCVRHNINVGIVDETTLANHAACECAECLKEGK